MKESPAASQDTMDVVEIEVVANKTVEVIDLEPIESVEEIDSDSKKTVEVIDLEAEDIDLDAVKTFRRSYEEDFEMGVEKTDKEIIKKTKPKFKGKKIKPLRFISGSGGALYGAVKNTRIKFITDEDGEEKAIEIQKPSTPRTFGKNKDYQQKNKTPYYKQNPMKQPCVNRNVEENEGFQPRNTTPFRHNSMSKPRQPWVNRNSGENTGFQPMAPYMSNQMRPKLPFVNRNYGGNKGFQQGFMAPYIETPMGPMQPWVIQTGGGNEGFQQGTMVPCMQYPMEPWVNQNAGTNDGFQQIIMVPCMPNPMTPMRPWVNQNAGVNKGFQQGFMAPNMQNPVRPQISQQNKQNLEQTQSNTFGQSQDVEKNENTDEDEGDEPEICLNEDPSGPHEFEVCPSPPEKEQLMKLCFKCGSTEHSPQNCEIKKQCDAGHKKKVAEARKAKKQTKKAGGHQPFKPMKFVKGGVLHEDAKNQKITFDPDGAEEPTEPPMKRKLSDANETPEEEEESFQPKVKKPLKQNPMKRVQGNDGETKTFEQRNQRQNQKQFNEQRSNFYQNLEDVPENNAFRSEHAPRKLPPCFNCRQPGHQVKFCPSLPKNEKMMACYKCGSTEHRASKCKIRTQNSYPFANCYICKKVGHIARQCPDNTQGVYPSGGACLICSSTDHLKVDCPTLKKQKDVKEGNVVDRIQDYSSPDAEDLFPGNSIKKETSKRPEHTVSKSVVF